MSNTAQRLPSPIDDRLIKHIRLSAISSVAAEWESCETYGVPSECGILMIVSKHDTQKLERIAPCGYYPPVRNHKPSYAKSVPFLCQLAD